MTGVKRYAAAFFLLTVCPFFSNAEGLRNITAVSVDYYFDASYRINVEDVFIVRLSPTVSALVKATRSDSPNQYEYVGAIGPIVNFTDNLYMEVLYSFGLDNAFHTGHGGEINLNYETETSVLGLGVKGRYFPEDSYYFILPSVSGRIQPVAWLSIFSKIFLSWNSREDFSGSYWGETAWILDPVFTIRTGFTLDWSGGFGYSIIAGLNFQFSPAVLLKYTFQFMDTTVDFSPVPQRRYGIGNGIVLDVKF
jgi:hypothetical protein